jgi:nucleoid DNA-binding protein
MNRSQLVDRNADAVRTTKIAASKGVKFTAGAGFKSAVN